MKWRLRFYQSLVFFNCLLTLDLIRIQNLDWGTVVGMLAQTLPNSFASTWHSSMRSLSESEGRSRGPSDYWVGPEPSYVHAMSTTPEHGTERMVSFHPSERDMDDTVSGSIARSRLLFGKGRKAKPVLSTTAIPPLALHLSNSHCSSLLPSLRFFSVLSSPISWRCVSAYSDSFHVLYGYLADFDVCFGSCLRLNWKKEVRRFADGFGARAGAWSNHGECLEAGWVPEKPVVNVSKIEGSGNMDYETLSFVAKPTIWGLSIMSRNSVNDLF